jgi:alpha-beta hydrolase superfamily lysophospholipase
MVAGEHSPSHAQQPPKGKRVELVARDGVHTAAFWFDCGKPGAPAAILLHDNGRDHFGWTPLVVQFQHAGIHVLALDLRGHGASQQLAPEKYQQLVTHDAAVYREMVLDAQAGIDYLQHEAHLPPARIAVVGAELGSSIGFALMGANPKLPCMIALSPSLHAYGYDTLDQLKRFGKRPLLIFTTKYQFSEATEAITNALRKTGAVQVALFPDREARGLAMLGRPPFIEHSIRNFLVSAFDLEP